MSDKQQLFNIVDSLEDAQITTLLSIAKLLYANTPTHSLSKQEAFSIVIFNFFKLITHEFLLVLEFMINVRRVLSTRPKLISGEGKQYSNLRHPCGELCR